MQQFIENILSFFRSIYNAINVYYTSFGSGSTQLWETFLSKNIFNGDFLSISLTYKELLLFLLPIIFVFIILWLFIRFFLKLLKVITG